ncbi:MAG TPA: hypothetical protein VF199_02580 [Bacillales bacterium]
MFEFFQLTLLLTSIVLTILLYKRLAGWWFRVKKFERDVEKHTRPSEQAKYHELLGTMAPSVQLTSVHNGQKFSLEQVSEGKDLVFAFMDKECIHCSNNFEIFLNETHKHSDITYAVIMDNLQTDEAKTFYDLHDGNVDIFVTAQSTFQDFQIPYLPAFFYIDSEKVIANVTPVPYFAFSKVNIQTYSA